MKSMVYIFSKAWSISLIEHMEMTTYVKSSRNDGCLALDNYPEQDFVSGIEGEIVCGEH